MSIHILSGADLHNQKITNLGSAMDDGLDEDRAHIVLTAMMEGNPVRLFLPNALPGSGTDQYQVS